MNCKGLMPREYISELQKEAGYGVQEATICFHTKSIQNKFKHARSKWQSTVFVG